MRPILRPARPSDFEYCARLYFAEMERTVDTLKLDKAAHEAGFRDRWNGAQVRIITLDGTDIGWLQSMIRDDNLFLAQLFVAPAYQRQGIGTGVMNLLIEEAARAGKAMTLGVVKANRALHLYQRLGFRTTHEDERKFYMRRDVTDAKAR